MYYANLSHNKFVLPGRVRIEIEGLKRNKEYADKITRYLSNIEGIQKIAANDITGTVLVLFDEKLLNVGIIERNIIEIKNKRNELLPNSVNSIKPEVDTTMEERQCLNKFLLSGAVLTGIMIKHAFTGRTPLARNYGVFSAAAITSILTGYPMFKRGLSKFKATRQINCDLLLGLSAFSCILLRESTLSLFTITIGYLTEVIEKYTHRKAQAVVQELLENRFRQVTKIIDNDEVLTEYGNLLIGDVIILYPGDFIPVDGKILDGKAVINNTPLTGQSAPLSVYPGNMIHSGALIQEGSIQVKITAVNEEVHYKKALNSIDYSWKEHLQTVNIVDKYYHKVMPYALSASIFSLIITGNFMTFITTLLIACPGPAYIAAPIALRSAFINACSEGILLKNPHSIEAISRLDSVVFDKTGTLSAGNPEVTDIISFDDYTDREVLTIAASCEKSQQHPMAKALLKEAGNRELKLFDISTAHSQIGKGIVCSINNKEAIVGNPQMMADRNIILRSSKVKEKQLKQSGCSPIYVAYDGKAIGIIAVKDTLRADTAAGLNYIHELGVRKRIIISGDDASIVENTAKELGIQEYYGTMMPEDKIKAINTLRKKNHVVAMVGDGINDCPALSGADIGITLADRLNNDTLKCSDIVVMNNRLVSIPALIDLSRFTESNMHKTYNMSVGLNIIGILLVFTNCINPFFASFYKDMNSLIVLLNSMRPLRYKMKYLQKQVI